MRILALDLATSTGWACGSPEVGRPVSHGILKLPKTGENIGPFLFAYREWLGAAIEELAPTEIFFEAPIMPAKVSLAATRKLYSLAGVTELIATDYKVPVRECLLLDIRRHFIGVVRAPADTPKDRRRAWLKDRVVKECRARGFRVAGDDDADAIALLSFAMSLQNGGFRLEQQRAAA